MKNNNHKKAYSLLEVSIALFIISILLVSGGIMFSQISRNQSIREAENITLNRADKIYKAILNYVAENKRLPCPAILNLPASDANYGNESRSGNQCLEIDSGFDFTGIADSQDLGVDTDMKLLYGMVPINVLNLQKKDSEDGYGNKFSYIIVKEFGEKTRDNTVTSGFEYFAGSERLGDVVDLDYINIYDRSSGSDQEISDNAVMLLISHGENARGAYNPDSNSRNSIANIIADEEDNIYENDIPTKYNRKFYIDSNQNNSSGDQLIKFDDFVIFKSKDELIREAEMEFIKCGAQQGQVIATNSCIVTSSLPVATNDYSESSNLTGATIVVSGDVDNCGCDLSIHSGLRRICGKYGKWSDISCLEDYQIQRVDEVRADSSAGLALSDVSGNGIVIKDGGNIGINQSNPEANIDINGTILIDADHPIGTNNFAMGDGSLSVVDPASNRNTAVGNNSLSDLTTGNYNTAIGFNALKSSIIGSNNTAIGDLALSNNTGNRNVAIGHAAMNHNLGSGNVAIGHRSLFSVSGETSSNNTAIGAFSGEDIEDGDNNIFIGNISGQNIVDGNNNVILGSYNGVSSTPDLADGSNDNNHIVLSDGSGNVRMYIDHTGFTTFGGDVTGTGAHFASDKRYKRNIKQITNILPKINQLISIYYYWKQGEFPDKSFSKKKQIGFIAQEVEKIFPELVHTDSRGYKSLSYNKLTVILVQAIQEMQQKQQQELLDLKNNYDKKIENLIKRIKKLENAQ